MRAAGRVAEEDFAAGLGHVMAHLNRAWNGRNHTGDVSSEEFEVLGRDPPDLPPVG